MRACLPAIVPATELGTEQDVRSLRLTHLVAGVLTSLLFTGSLAMAVAPAQPTATHPQAVRTMPGFDKVRHREYSAAALIAAVDPLAVSEDIVLG